MVNSEEDAYDNSNISLDQRIASSDSKEEIKKCLDKISLKMLNDITITKDDLIYMADHVKCSDYLIRCYFRYPDITVLETLDTNNQNFKYLPTEITGIMPKSKRRELDESVGKKSFLQLYDICLAQYCRRIDGSLKFWKGNLKSLDYIQNKLFTQDEFEIWKENVLLYALKKSSQKLYSMDVIFETTAIKLKSFKYTDADIDMMLKKKHSKKLQDLIFKKTELESKLDQDFENEELKKELTSLLKTLNFYQKSKFEETKKNSKNKSKTFSFSNLSESYIVKEPNSCHICWKSSYYNQKIDEIYEKPKMETFYSYLDIIKNA